ncbi:lipopolysaccharide biosynthesis protein [Paenibacillus pinistramenti]|uniref:lipopolysaccharide biosynthesis protein n=1 Tax=Paenibacillus pinistramenti TaxID=1768003 RepID=UPI001EF08703|nr:oligosaccharide flippase family protein [Paenibacillus pinistramenti]
MEQSNVKSFPGRSVFSTFGRFARSKAHSSAALKTMFFSIFILVINMLTGVLTARFLGPTGRGEQTAMVNWSQFLAFCMTFGIPSALVYNAKKKEEQEGGLYATALVMGIGFGLAATAIGVIVLPFWLKSFNHDVILFAQWSMILCPIVVISQINNAILQVRDDYKRYNRLRYIVPLTTMLILAALILTGTMNAHTSAAAYLLPAVPFYIAMTVRMLRIYGKQLKVSLDNFKRLFTYGLGSYGNDLMGQVSYYIDQILIAGLLSPADLGLYAVAVSLAKMVNVFSNSIIVVLFPKASGLDKQEAVNITFRAFRISTAVTLLASLVLMLIAPYVLTLLYGPEFKEALTVFRLLLLQIAIGGGTMVLAQAFMALGKPKVVTLLQGLGLVLVVPMLFLLVPRYGLVGAGYAMLASVLIRFIFILLNFKYSLKMKIPPLWVTREDIKWLRSTMNSTLRKKSVNV